MSIPERVRLRLRLRLDDSSHLATQPSPTRGSGHLVPPMFPFLIAFHLSATICMTISTFSCVSGTAGFPVLFGFLLRSATPLRVCFGTAISSVDIPSPPTLGELWEPFNRYFCAGLEEPL